MIPVFSVLAGIVIELRAVCDKQMSGIFHKVIYGSFARNL
jgi:hypothetical protein